MERSISSLILGSFLISSSISVKAVSLTPKGQDIVTLSSVITGLIGGPLGAHYLYKNWANNRENGKINAALKKIDQIAPDGDWKKLNESVSVLCKSDREKVMKSIEQYKKVWDDPRASCSSDMTFAYAELGEQLDALKRKTAYKKEALAIAATAWGTLIGFSISIALSERSGLIKW